MKVLKKVMAVAMALVMVVALAPATKAEATIKSTVDKAYFAWQADYGFWSCPTKEFYGNVTEIYGVQFILDVSDISGGFGGGVVINSETNSWDQREWGNEGAEKTYVAEATGEDDEYMLTMLCKEPCFVPEDNWANFVIQQWWGGDITVKSIRLLNQKGKVLFDTANPPVVAESPVPEAPAEDVAPVADVTAKTGDSFTFVIFGLAALCAAAFVTMKVTKKAEN